MHCVSQSFEFLDLKVTLSHPQVTIEASQSKPVTPLCHTSAHSHNVLTSWPNSVCNTVHVLSGGSKTPAKSQLALAKLYRRYKHAHAHPATLNLIRKWQPTAKVGNAGSARDSLLVCPMRYHPVVQHSLYVANKLAPPPSDLRIRVMGAWRNALPSLAGVINGRNKYLLK